MYDLIIVGGGPAGLAAAIYAVRKHLDVMLISPDLGGKAAARTAVEGEAYRVINGADVVRRFRDEMEYLDFARLFDKVVELSKTGSGFRVATENGHELEARTVILATGAEGVRLAAPGADRYFLKGIMYSTVSYAPLFAQKQVAIVGADRMALRGAAELAQIASEVYLVAPEHGELDSAIGRRVRNSARVSLFDGWHVAGVEGDTMARRLIVESPAGERRTLLVDGIFVELGLKPHAELVQGWVEQDNLGRVVVNCRAETSVPGLFAAGDVTNLPAEQVLIAIGEGAKATLNAFEHVLRLEEVGSTAG